MKRSANKHGKKVKRFLLSEIKRKEFKKIKLEGEKNDKEK